MNSTPGPVRVGFLGTGRMATALASGLIRAGFASADQICGSDVEPAARQRFAETTGATAADTNSAVVDRSDVVVVAVKPQQVADVLNEIRPRIEARHLVVSIAAGVPLATFAQALGETTRVVRVMPNTPCLVGASASAWAPGEHCTPDDAALMQKLLSTVGLAVRVPEKLLDAVTGLSGSGPAYVCQIIEALSDGGVRMGLPRETALQLAAQTVLGTARMVLETGEHPAALKDAVASPGGTTIAGLQVLERAGLRGALIDAVEAAARRSQELAGR